MCGEEKVFPVRQQTCSNECARLLRFHGTHFVRPTLDDIKPTDHDVNKPTPSSETRSETDRELTLELGRTRIKTLDQLIVACEVDTSTWECYRFTASKCEMAGFPRATGSNKDGWERASTKPIVTPLFNVKAWFKKKIAVVDARAEIASLREDAKRVAPVRFPLPHECAGNTMLELSIPDLHLGKLAWAKETGWEDYDSGIARKCFEDAVRVLLDRTSSHALSEIVLVLGNDLLNSDNREHTTTHGTPQTSTDTRYQKTFRDARRMATAAIEMCCELAPVRVVLVPGNHDQLSVWHLGDSLECLFANSPDVVIDNSPTLRKYYQFGATGLMWTHGDKGKHSGLPLLFARERPDIWGATRFQEIHLGHLHQTRVQELNGVRVRILPSLCAADEWHSEMGFVGAVRGAEAFVWDIEEGLIGTANYSVPEDPNSPRLEAA